MIQAAIVGMGWWGRTLVEAVADSEQIRFVAGATRTVSPEVEAFSEAQHSDWSTHYDALLAEQKRGCGRPGDAALAARGADDRGGEGGEARVLREALRAAQGRCGSGGRGDGHAGVTLGLGYNRRFHPEMTKLRQQIQSGRARDDPSLRSDDDVSECAVSETRRVARRQGRDAVRRADADGRARHRRHD